MRRAGALLPIALASAPAVAAEKPVPLTKESVRTMAPEELARRVFGDLGHVMYPLPYSEPRGSGVSTMPLRALWFLTRPRRSYRAGLCETDRIAVAFEPVPYSLGRDPAVRPYRFEKYENHFVQDFAKARTGDPVGDEEDEAALESACAATDPRNVNIIVASSPFEIVAGLDSLADLVEAAKAGRAPAPLDCRDESGEPITETECLKNLARLEPGKLYHATFVEGCGRKDADIYCRRLAVWDVTGSIDVDFEFKPGGKEPLRILVKPSFDESSITT
jgi:hypothetical protein